MADKNTIRNWFRTGLRPTQAQFWATWDSFWHKDEMIPVSKINNLQNVLNEKADQEALRSHLTNPNAHANLFNQIKTTGRFLINRNNVMMFADEPIVGDTVTGMVEGEYLNAGSFYGGNFELLSSYVEPQIIGRIISYLYGNISLELNESVISRYNSQGGELCRIRIVTPDGTVYTDFLYVSEEQINNPVTAYLQGPTTPGSQFTLYYESGEFEDSEVYILPEFAEASFNILGFDSSNGMTFQAPERIDRNIQYKVVHYSNFGDLISETLFSVFETQITSISNELLNLVFPDIQINSGQVNIQDLLGNNVSNLFTF